MTTLYLIRIMPAQESIMIPSIHIRDACLRFAGSALFQKLSFTLQAGSTSCLLGPSGVGKTSLLRLIAGLIKPDAYLSGQVDPSDSKPLQNRIAYMAQNDSLLPWLTVTENVLLGFSLRGNINKKQRERAASLLHSIGISQYATSHPASLSGGMRQRVAIARTLLENKPVVLLDEPFASLDAITKHELQSLAASAFKGKTVLLVTHDPLEALRIGDYIYVMQGVPATINDPIVLPEGAPRSLKDDNILKLHSLLLDNLSRAKGVSSSC